MDRNAWIAGLLLLSAACGGDDTNPSGASGGTGGSGASAGDGGGSGNGGNGGMGGSAGTPPLLVSALDDCATVSNPCLTADLGAATHVIAPELFGDGIEWTTHGQTVLEPDTSGQSAGALRPDVMQALGEVGFRVMRYPGGTLSDLFHWDEAVGPVGSRIPQRTLSFDTNTNSLETELPLFGPDELVDFSAALGVEIGLTVNVMTGTAAEAAAWILYWKEKGIRPSWVEIGNEAYLALVNDAVMPPLDPAEYAARYDEWAKAIRAVDPTLRLGALGTMETSSWCYPSCAAPAPWNQVVLQAITEKIDFLAVHNAYAPGTSDVSATTYEAMLAYPEFVRFDDSLIAADIELFANPSSKNIPLAKTEFASFFVPPATSDIEVIKSVVMQNQTWGAALYSGLVLQTFVSNPRVVIANHINPLHYLWQAPITLSIPDFATYPNGYEPNPTLSAYGSVFQAYSELAGARFASVAALDVPVMSTQPVGLAPALDDVPLLDAVGAVEADANPTKGWVFVINRSLTTALDVSIVLQNVPAGATLLELEVLNAGDYTDKTAPGSTPVATWKQQVFGLLPSGSQPFGLELSVPEHSIVRVRVRP